MRAYLLAGSGLLSDAPDLLKAIMRRGYRVEYLNAAGADRLSEAPKPEPEETEPGYGPNLDGGDCDTALYLIEQLRADRSAAIKSIHNNNLFGAGMALGLMAGTLDALAKLFPEAAPADDDPES